jgi:hypothetical protein
MTVQELKKLLENYNDDACVEIGVISKDEYGDTCLSCYSIDRGESYIPVQFPNGEEGCPFILYQDEMTRD